MLFSNFLSIEFHNKIFLAPKLKEKKNTYHTLHPPSHLSDKVRPKPRHIFNLLNWFNKKMVQFEP